MLQDTKQAILDRVSREFDRSYATTFKRPNTLYVGQEEAAALYGITHNDLFALLVAGDTARERLTVNEMRVVVTAENSHLFAAFVGDDT